MVFPVKSHLWNGMLNINRSLLTHIKSARGTKSVRFQVTVNQDWKMHFFSFSFALLFCGLVLAQDDGSTAGTEGNIEVQSCVISWKSLVPWQKNLKLWKPDWRTVRPGWTTVKNRFWNWGTKVKITFKDFINELIKNFVYCDGKNPPNPTTRRVIKMFCFTQKEPRWCSLQ